MAVDNGRRIIDQDTSLVIYPEDNIIIDSITNGTRKISYEALCAAVAETLGIAAIRTKANGSMQISVYDANRDGIVDNAEALQGHDASYFAKATDVSGLSTEVGKKMNTATYDSNENGIVDNAEKVNNHTVYSDVPAQAVFTDTVYDDTQIKQDMGDLEDLETVAKGSLVEAINEAAEAGRSGEALGLAVSDGKLCAVYNT